MFHTATTNYFDATNM